ncbi:MAG TPA: GAF domain-containing protein, partial [Candidatus Dormibacteraeota bacterium]|nr:GAF domain-containing protein [Candidatus Dormibacteraeota bacterium]
MVVVQRGSRPRRRADPRALGRVLRTAAALAYSATEIDEMLRSALEIACACTGWPLGHVYRREAHSDVLSSAALWYADDLTPFEPFVRVTNSMTFRAGAGLPGRILSSGQPESILDIASDRNFPRADVAAACGIGAAFGFPIVGGRGVEAVMEFFAPSGGEADGEVLEVISHLGFQLGSAIDRARTQLERERFAAAHVAGEARLLEAQRIARMGSWNWKVGEDAVSWSAELYRIYGLETTHGPVGLGDYLGHVH